VTTIGPPVVTEVLSITKPVDPINENEEPSKMFTPT